MLLGLKSKFEIACVLALLISGVLHAGLFTLSERSWEDPLSFRKATLFGLSTGLTLWSCLWAYSYLKAWRRDDAVRKTLCLSLVLEVFLITIQTWRNEASHFNDEGLVNRVVEQAMILLITIAVLAIVQITCRCWTRSQLLCQSNAMFWATRWGMLLLCLSALIGYVITWIGQQQINQGLSPYVWKTRGILKFPHGAALHAVQTLAIAAWTIDRLQIPNRTIAIHFLASAHIFWLFYALFQTFNGLGRFEFNSLGLMLLAAVVVCSVAGVAVTMIRKLASTESDRKNGSG